MSELAQRYTHVQERIAQAAHRAGRNPDEITLIAVTKTWPAEIVAAAYDVGMRQFGENRPEELAPKRRVVLEALGADSGIVWHQIGTVQSRKTNLVAENADVFHALDRLKIARRLSRHLQDEGRDLPLFLEVNVSGESTKAGWNCTNWEDSATQRNQVRNVVSAIAGLPSVQLQGLMTMAPWEAPEEIIRSVFRRTRTLAEWLCEKTGQTKLLELSMGMTDDFEIAIEEGATHVRIGRAIFGSRR